MQLKYLKTLIDGQTYINRIAGIAWSPNHQKLAIATADRHIYIFDEYGEKRDKFSTKPSNPNNGKNSYVIRGIAFNSDSTKLAVAQSDCIVYVYRLGEGWNEKKVICNKFPQSTSVTCMIWLNTGTIIAGLDDGKVRSLNCKTNKSQSLYSSENMVISLAPNTKGTGFLSGHFDGTVIRFFLLDDNSNPRHSAGIESSGKLFQHSVPPFALAWPQGGIAAAGCDKKIVFYDSQGRQIRNFDFSRNDSEKEFLVATSSSNGQAVAFGSFDRIRIFSWSPRLSSWSESASKEIEHLYSITALTWRKDGAKLAIGSTSGAVIIFESVLKRTIWQEKFEIIYVAPSQVLVKTLHEPFEQMTIESHLGLEIDDIRIMGKDNYLVAKTEDSLLLCDLTRNLTSEIPWNTTGSLEKFYFENPNVCLIFNAGELSLVEYGENIILGSVRTEFVNPHVISIRLNERGNNSGVDNKKLAYLLDMKTICVLDLITNSIITQVGHDSKIDWIELNETAHKLLFRDKKMRLVLVDISTGKKQTLLGNVSFVQWVIQSDVAVAQSDNNLAIWYNIDLPEHVTLMPIRGDAFDVIRDDSRTIVKTQEGPTDHSYQLDEGLVEFGTALNDSDFGRAILFLETLGDKPAAKAMWLNLAIIALEQENLRVAQRCYAALGNVSKAFYLNEMIMADEKYKEINGINATCPEVQAKMALLNSDLRTAERIYLEQGDIEKALNMYKNLRMWDDAINLAEKRGYSGISKLREDQMKFLLMTNQEEKAGKVWEERGDAEKAIQLYLKARKAPKAARLLLKTPALMENEDLVAQITEALLKSELFELAGDIALKLSRPEAALTLYRKGAAYPRAVELARQVAPDDVIALEEEWGDWLVSKKQLDASINHYIEAGATEKALEAAVGAKQWRKAVQIAKVLDEPEEIKKHALDLSKHLAFAGDLDGAEDLLVRANMFKEAIDLLNKHGQWEKAYNIAETYMSSEITRDIFINLSRTFEDQGKYRDAEKVLIAINEPDLAIAMYKRRELYDSMIRLVEKYHKELLESTHLHLAKQLEAKGKLKNAEIHFIAAGDWKSAVHMYCNAGRWDDGYRIAKQKGTDGASNQVAYMWAKSLPIEGAARLLTRLGLIDTALNFACDSGQFDFAIDLCRLTGKPTEDVHYKIAMSLEDEGKFDQAEIEFIKANKPKEAILMHTHGGDWQSALRVAEKYLPDAINEILLGQATAALETRNYPDYENLLLQAGRPDIIIQQYKELNMIEDAVRIAEEHHPVALNDLRKIQTQERRRNTNLGSANADSRSYLQQASDFARNEEFRKAAECLLQIDSTNADDGTIERALIRAAEICNQFLEGKDALDVSKQLGPRLLEINQIGPAAQLYLAADLPKEAVEVFIQAEQWAKARRLAKEIDSELVTYVEQQQKSRLKNEGNIEQLADIDIVSALDMLAEQGQWVRCLEKARQLNGKALHKYLALYAAQLIRDGEALTALSLYITNGAPAIEQNFNIYYRIALECFSLREAEIVDYWKDLRTFLYQLTTTLKASEFGETEVYDRFDKLLLIAHYYTTRAACRQIQALQQIAVKISAALLRYTGIIPVDKGFYEAGMDLRSVGREPEAFVILNHYLDVCEAIEDGSGNLVDHSDLATTDFPSSVPIPENLHLRNETNLHEEAREWILAVSMDQRVDQNLPTDGRNLFESSLGLSDLECIVTGYPVTGRQPILFQKSKKQANRDAWSKLTVAAKMNPTSNIPDVIEFIEKWCGSANFLINT
ncbi:intraflagellar transport protein 172 homolog [Condylostylus longicornis]|uniref:intraflagellar transport protein 172 homolog n=1 Tax=Condylostylus longicornis TaxID=2530218 RepID=UPI00244DF580|nr:intraflagellar transport protein 172 homolog [Condylostylus longicornis]